MMIKSKKLGFTMVELVIVIAITGILASILAIFIRIPVIAYEDTYGRAELTDQASSIIKAIKKDIRMSLPNSIRVSTVGNKTYLELISVVAGGKYRSQNATGGTGNILDFTFADTSFDVLSGPMTFKGGEKIVVANIGSPGFDAYSSSNMTDYNGALNVPVNTINIVGKLFPLESPNENFYVVDKPITYMCDKDTKTVIKYWSYAINTTQPVNNLATPLLTSKSTLIANNVANCNFIYNQGENTRNGIVTIIVTVSNKAQEATLYGDTYVRNI